MKRLIALAAAALMLGSLAGCIVVPDGGGYYYGHPHGYYYR